MKIYKTLKLLNLAPTPIRLNNRFLGKTAPTFQLISKLHNTPKSKFPKFK